MQYVCVACGETHDGVPGLGAPAPLYYYAIPESERRSRCRLESETCVVDEEFFFVRGCLEVPIEGGTEPFVWGVWVSLSEGNFEIFCNLLEADQRSSQGPFVGWLSAALGGYPNTENLRARVHLRDGGHRPFIELEPTDHPLAVEQRTGISVARVAEILSAHEHPAPREDP